MKDHFNALSGELESLGRKYELAKVFNDFLTISICSYHRVNVQSRCTVQDPQNEKLCMDTIRTYRPEELTGFARMLGELQLQVYDDPYSDILGRYYTEHITRGHNGQYFTPRPVADLLAQLQGGDKTVEGQTILDPACGSGRLLLSFAEKHPDNHFFGADNNHTCAKISTLNFFLNGLRGEVSWMDSLSMEWHGGWHINTRGLGIVPIDQEESLLWQAAPLPGDSDPQLSLF